MHSEMRKKETSKRRMLLEHLDDAASQLSASNEALHEREETCVSLVNGLSSLLTSKNSSSIETLKAELRLLRYHAEREMTATKQFFLSALRSLLQRSAQDHAQIQLERDQVISCKAQLQELQKQKENSTQINSALSSEVNTLREQVQQQQQYVSKLLQELRTQSALLDESDKRARETEIRLQQQLGEAENRATTETTLREKLVQTETELRQQIEDVSKKAETNSTTLRNTLEDLSNLQLKYRVDVEKLQRSCQQTETNFKQHQTLVSEQDQRIQQFKQQVETYQQQERKMRKQLEDSHQVVSQLENKIRQLQEQLEEGDTRFKDQVSILAEHNMQLDTKVVDLDVEAKQWKEKQACSVHMC